MAALKKTQLNGVSYFGDAELKEEERDIRGEGNVLKSRRGEKKMSKE
jgi:hypothetical protein